MESLGLDYTSRDASNASFSVDGEELTSQSNHLTLGQLFDIRLTGISPEGQPTKIGLKTDVESPTDPDQEQTADQGDEGDCLRIWQLPGDHGPEPGGGRDA